MSATPPASLDTPAGIAADARPKYGACGAFTSESYGSRQNTSPSCRTRQDAAVLSAFQEPMVRRLRFGDKDCSMARFLLVFGARRVAPGLVDVYRSSR